jgi:hypothetical protein
MDNKRFNTETRRSGESSLSHIGGNHNALNSENLCYRSGGVMVELEQIVHHDVVGNWTEQRETAKRVYWNE